MISELPRKSLPGLPVVDYRCSIVTSFFAAYPWQVEQFRARRLELIKQLVGKRSIILCIDETGDKKAERVPIMLPSNTSVGKTDNGIVSVNAYAVVDNITYPLLFKIFKPLSRLQPGDVYKRARISGGNSARA